MNAATDRDRRRPLAWLLIPLILSAPLAAAEADGNQPAGIPSGPYLQNLTPNSVTITWADNTLCKGLVDYGESKDKLDRQLPATVVNPQDEKPWNGYQQEVTIGGLEPGRIYYYRVTSTPNDGGQALSSDLGSLATPTSDEKAFTFAVIADTHDYRNASDLAARLHDEQPHFILHAGDYNKAKTGLFPPYRSVLQRIPIYFARGNHDSVAKHQQFVAMPGPGNDLYYSFRRGNALFLSVDTNDHKGLVKGGRQYQWLEGELKDSEDAWKFVFLHHPVYSAYRGEMDAGLDEARQLFEKYKVDVVFQGHMHHYDRSYPLREQKPVSRADGGVTYITASGACGGYEKFPHPHRLWFIAKQWRGEPFVGLCTVNDKHAMIQFVTAKGLLFDSLELRARQAGRDLRVEPNR